MGLVETYAERDHLLKLHGYASYVAYLHSSEWLTLRKQIYARTALKWNYCNVCCSSGPLDIHHLSYKIIGNPNAGNTVMMLCRSCHNNFHEYAKLNPKKDFYKIPLILKKERLAKGLPIWIPPPPRIL